MRRDVLYNVVTLELCVVAGVFFANASWVTDWGWPFWVRVVVDLVGLALLATAIARLYWFARRRRVMTMSGNGR